MGDTTRCKGTDRTSGKTAEAKDTLFDSNGSPPSIVECIAVLIELLYINKRNNDQRS